MLATLCKNDVTVQQAFSIAPGPMYTGHKPERSDAYRRWVKPWPCAACRKPWGIDPAHTGPHGTAQKASDFTCIPLCRQCHRQYDTDPRGFAARVGLSVSGTVRKLNRIWKGRAA